MSRPIFRQSDEERYGVPPTIALSLVRTFKVAYAKLFTITTFGVLTIKVRPAEYHVPEIFSNPTRRRRRYFGRPQPLPDSLIFKHGSFVDLFFRHGKLRATRCTSVLGQFTLWKPIGPDIGNGTTLLAVLVFLTGDRPGVDWAARIPSASEVDITLLLNKGESEVADNVDAVEHWVVVVPLDAAGMVEEGDVREVVIIIYDISQKYGALVTALKEDGEVRIFFVDDVNIEFPIWEIFFEP